MIGVALLLISFIAFGFFFLLAFGVASLLGPRLAILKKLEGKD